MCWEVPVVGFPACRMYHSSVSETVKVGTGAVSALDPSVVELSLNGSSVHPDKTWSLLGCIHRPRPKNVWVGDFATGVVVCRTKT